MSEDRYICKAIRTTKDKLAESNCQPYKNTKLDIHTIYRPELDVSLVLGDDQSSYYLSSVVQFKWSVELRRIDINIEIALLYHFLYQLRCVHLDKAFHVFLCIKSHGRINIVLDPHKNNFDIKFIDHDCQYFYSKV